MKFVNLGKSSLKVSEMCLGTMTFGNKTDQAESKRIVYKSLDSGINFFDTANAYNEGKSEIYLGKAIAGIRRKVVIATKVGSPRDSGVNNKGSSRHHIIKTVEISLKRLGTDYIDLYQIHMPHPGMNLSETLSALDCLIKQGKVLDIGCSNFPAWLLCKSLWISDIKKLASFISLQSVYNLIERGIEVEILPLCHAEGLSVLTYRPLCAGILTGKYISDRSLQKRKSQAQDEKFKEWIKKFNNSVKKLIKFASIRGYTAAQAVISWVRSHPAVTCPVVGITSADQLNELAGAFEWSITAEERKEISSYFETEMVEYDLGVHAGWRKSFDLLI